MAILEPIRIRCEFNIAELDLIETALNGLMWRNQEQKEAIKKTLANVQVQRTFGERSK